MTPTRLLILASLFFILTACGGGGSGPSEGLAEIQGSSDTGNTPPEIGGIPATTASVGRSYVFTPTASDADGDTLSFGITGKPSWAAFDTGTGTLSGTPTASDNGSSSTIMISVSDGKSVTTLAAFTLTVEGSTAPALDITATSIAGYQWDILATGKAVYVDRGYTYSSVPAAYAGLSYLKTANNDKTSTGDNFLSFVVNQSVTVFIGHDTRIASKPAWLSTWSDTGAQLTTTDTTLRLFSKNFPAGTVTLGGNGGDSGGSMYTVLVTAQGSTGGGSGTAVPFANADSATTSMDNAVMIDVLANDSGLTDTPVTVTLISSPGHGTAVVNADQTIGYMPAAGFTGTDTLNYQVSDADGDLATAAVTIDVTCGSCATGVSLVVTWDANPAPENILDYSVYAGPLPDSTATLVGTVTATATPSLTVDAWNDLGLRLGDTVCFRIKARNDLGPSPFSSAVCGTL